MAHADLYGGARQRLAAVLFDASVGQWQLDGEDPLEVVVVLAQLAEYGGAVV